MNEIAIQSQTEAMSPFNFASELVGSNNFYTSLSSDDPKTRKVLFNAMTSPTAKLGDMIGKKIVLTDVFCESITMEKKDADGNPVLDDETGEPIRQNAPRIVLITKDGNSYQCVSTGIFNALQKLISIFGEPSWTDGIEVEVKQIQKTGKNGVRNILTLAM